MGDVTNAISSPPNFHPHRQNITAADGAAVTTKSSGVEAAGFRFLLLDVVLVSGTLTDLDLEVMFWSDAADGFVSSTDGAFTISNLTDSARIALSIYGQRFWVMVTTIAGTSPVVDIYVAGFSEPAIS